MRVRLGDANGVDGRWPAVVGLALVFGSLASVGLVELARQTGVGAVAPLRWMGPSPLGAWACALGAAGLAHIHLYSPIRVRTLPKAPRVPRAADPPGIRFLCGCVGFLGFPFLALCWVWRNALGFVPFFVATIPLEIGLYTGWKWCSPFLVPHIGRDFSGDILAALVMLGLGAGMLVSGMAYNLLDLWSARWLAREGGVLARLAAFLVVLPQRSLIFFPPWWVVFLGRAFCAWLRGAQAGLPEHEGPAPTVVAARAVDDANAPPSTSAGRLQSSRSGRHRRQETVRKTEQRVRDYLGTVDFRPEAQRTLYRAKGWMQRAAVFMGDERIGSLFGGDDVSAPQAAAAAGEDDAPSVPAGLWTRIAWLKVDGFGDALGKRLAESRAGLRKLDARPASVLARLDRRVAREVAAEAGDLVGDAREIANRLCFLASVPEGRGFKQLAERFLFAARDVQRVREILAGMDG